MGFICCLRTNPSMKILYLLFAFIFLAFLSEPGNAQPRCRRLGGRCFQRRCPPISINVGGQDCRMGFICCLRH
ncbi:hypothetical protein E2320_001419 [Naja naja]|nr:hypothetical protein E2320_001419 [Naja naja]